MLVLYLPGPTFDVFVGAGDFDFTFFADEFLDPNFDFRTSLLLRTFVTAFPGGAPASIFNLTQVGFIAFSIPDVTDAQIQSILSALPSTFTRCTDLSSAAAQEI